jgi:hypothetical protein
MSLYKSLVLGQIFPAHPIPSRFFLPVYLPPPPLPQKRRPNLRILPKIIVDPWKKSKNIAVRPGAAGKKKLPVLHDRTGSAF